MNWAVLFIVSMTVICFMIAYEEKLVEFEQWVCRKVKGVFKHGK